jgi:putative membrane protein
MRKMIVPALAALMLASGAAVAQKAENPDKAEAVYKVATPDFAKTVMSSNEFEIQSSKLAEEKAAAADVKEFAKQMIADHTKAGEGLKAALEKSNMTPEPPKLSPKHAAMVEQLKAASGEDFQMLYIDMQTQAHMEAVTLFRTYSGSGDDQNVVAFAKETLPTLEMHLMHVKELVAAH